MVAKDNRSHLESGERAMSLTPVPSMRLSQLRRGQAAQVRSVESRGATDPIAQRLRELGFVADEPVRVVAHAPMGADPLLVQIGFTRFALRRAEAERVIVEAAA
jgi:ferrous iron transport protein A